MRAPVPGQPFGAYRIDSALQRGGMGAVFRATDSVLGRTVAIKVMLAATEAEDGELDPDFEGSIARFLREGRVAASLAHPGIVTIYEIGTHEDTPFLVMEWVSGETLRTVIRVDELAPTRRLAIAREIAEVVAYAHGQGVIHRDLKPGNVIIDGEGKPKLLDFGVAKRVAGTAKAHPLTFATRDDVLLGTPSYMAPEQRLSPAVDARADQFAWAVMTYELCSGKHPRMPDPLAPPRLDEVSPFVPRGIADVVHRAMAPHADDRFASMEEVLDAWRAALPRSLPNERASRQTSRAPTRRAPRGLVALAAGLTVVVLGAAVVLTRGALLTSRDAADPVDVRKNEAGPTVPVLPNDADASDDAAAVPAVSTTTPSEAGATRRAAHAEISGYSTIAFSTKPQVVRDSFARLEPRLLACLGNERGLGTRVHVPLAFVYNGGVRPMGEAVTCTRSAAECARNALSACVAGVFLRGDFPRLRLNASSESVVIVVTYR